MLQGAQNDHTQAWGIRNVLARLGKEIGSHTEWLMAAEHGATAPKSRRIWPSAGGRSGNKGTNGVFDGFARHGIGDAFLFLDNDPIEVRTRVEAVAGVFLVQIPELAPKLIQNVANDGGLHIRCQHTNADLRLGCPLGLTGCAAKGPEKDGGCGANGGMETGVLTPDLLVNVRCLSTRAGNVRVDDIVERRRAKHADEFVAQIAGCQIEVRW